RRADLWAFHVSPPATSGTPGDPCVVTRAPVLPRGDRWNAGRSTRPDSARPTRVVIEPSQNGSSAPPPPPNTPPSRRHLGDLGRRSLTPAEARTPFEEDSPIGRRSAPARTTDPGRTRDAAEGRHLGSIRILAHSPEVSRPIMRSIRRLAGPAVALGIVGI